MIAVMNMFPRNFTPRLFGFLLLFLFPLTLPAQEGTVPQSEPQEVQEPEVPRDSLERDTPRGTVQGFISAVGDQNYSRASRFLNMNRNLTENDQGERLVGVLESLLDRGGSFMPYSWISDDPSGRVDDDLPEGVDRVGTVSADGVDIDLFVEQTRPSDEGSLWLFSAETVETIAAITIKDEVFIERISPDFLKNRSWGGVPIVQWLAVFLLAVIAYFVSWLIISVVRFLIVKSWWKARTEPTSGIIESLSLPFRLYLGVWLFIALSETLQISIILRQRFSGVTIIIGILALLILLWQLSDFVGTYSKKRMSLRGNASGVSVILFLRRAAKIAILVFGSIAILGTLGVDVTTGLAALGIGGIALALGAQKTVENFVGSVTVIVDQPVRVGDFCKVGETVGTVESIGMRSTRIRTLERTIVTIPNGKFSSDTIENYAHRDRFLFTNIIALRYETTPDQIRYLLVEIRKILYSHPLVSPDPARIRLLELGETSLDLEIFSYITAPNFDEYLEVKEDVLLRIMDTVAESGTDFAFPSQTLYFARDRGVSDEKARAAEERVRSWKEKKEMPIPAFDPEQIQKIKGSIPYPPEGSVKRKASE